MLSFYLSLAENDYNRDKLDMLYNKYHAFMIAIAMKYLINKDIAEDIVHDAILRIINHLQKLDLKEEYRTKRYLYTVVKHLAIDANSKLTEVICEDIDDISNQVEAPEPLPLDKLISREGYEDIVGAIKSLNDTYRYVCELKYFEKMTEREIAKTLGLSPKVVNVRIFRARQILIKQIRERMKNER